MRFRDIQSQNELLCNLKSEISGNTLKVSWSWPIGCSKLMVFVLPEAEPFDPDACEGYRSFVVHASNQKNYFTDTIDFTKKCQYLLFTVDNRDDSLLIRQPPEVDTVIRPDPPIIVKYYLSSEKEGRFKGLFGKHKPAVQSLHLISTSDLSGGDLCYRFHFQGGMSGSFTFPCPIRQNVPCRFDDIELQENERLELIPGRPNIKLLPGAF
ncbi:hypothetical protein [Candidatus Soleaferrea massiliensis]|uniref:hypothetical protein n=1 Tax=Candidatus Soleaferrea massiliensis TaxID=1470354 RepID=UPI00058B7585|nr:hypothetical protein [Candidatus Soleaferrea massiliensis]